MAQDEVLACSRFFLEFDGGLDDLIIKSVSGLSTTLDAAGDMKAFGVRKDAKSFMQATVSGVTNGTITVVFVASAENLKMHDWYRESHAPGPMTGGGSSKKGERKTASLTVYNQAGEPAAMWKFSGVFPKSYKTSKMEPGSTELFTETVEFIYEGMLRMK